jgi:hypothetical protein
LNYFLVHFYTCLCKPILGQDSWGRQKQNVGAECN